VFLTYDITRDETFDNLRSWLHEIKQHAAADVRVYLIGNKSELDSQREVLFERAIEFAKSQGIHKCFETSARTGQNVEEVFSCAGKELYHQAIKEKKEAETATPGKSAGSAAAKGKGSKRVSLTQGNVHTPAEKSGCKC